MNTATRYRIVRDSYSGYEAQYRPWWFPVYLAIPRICSTNTCATVEEARELCDLHARHGNTAVVEYYVPRSKTS